MKNNNKTISSTINNNNSDVRKETNLSEKFGHIETANKKEEEGVASAKEIGIVSENKESVSAEKDATYQKLLSKVKKKVVSNKINEEEIASDAEMISLQKDAESRVQVLMDLAKEKGLVHSVKTARHLDSNYILDCLHDKLLEEKFTEAGLID